MNKDWEKRLDKVVNKILNHEAIKFANSQIAFNALRQGGSGYEGKPFDKHIKKVIKKFIQSEIDNVIELLKVRANSLASPDGYVKVDKLFKGTKDIDLNKYTKLKQSK